MTVQLNDLRAGRGHGFTLRVPRWQAEAGELHAVLGTNGAGKSTFFAALSGELACAGEVWLHGRPLGEWPARARARHLGVLPQHSDLSFAFTAREVVALGLTPLSLGWRDGQKALREVMRRTDCAHLAGRAYPGLSGGERQRVNLARVLLQLTQAERAPLLLLDEPTSAQDLGHQHALLRLARELASEAGFTVVAILHDLNQALRYADRCLLLADGVPVAEGRPMQVLTPETIARYWGYPARRIDAGAGQVVLA